MKTFKQIREETEQIKQERERRISQGIPAEFDTYRSIGHDDILPGYSREEEQRARQITADVFGIHPDKAPLPHLWAAGPHIKPNTPGEPVTIKPLEHREQVHSDLFPEINRSEEEEMRGIPPKYYVGGRIDHVRRTISMAFGPIDSPAARARYSSSSLDRMVKHLKQTYPGYTLVDQTIGNDPRII